MIELAPDSFETVAPLFAGIDHNVALVFGVIEGNSRGRIFVDRCDSSASALAISEVGYCYVGGASTNEDFNRALAPLLFDRWLPQMDEKELILFAFSDAWRASLDAVLRPYGVITIHRKVFVFNPACFAAHVGWHSHIPDGCAIRAIDADLAARYPEYAPLVDARTRRFGVCLMCEDDVVSTCMAVSVGGGEAEVDIHTEEPHQGRGYGFLTACAFIDESLARGLTPAWSCWPHRTASQALALKLGFEAHPDVPAHFWAEEM